MDAFAFSSYDVHSTLRKTVHLPLPKIVQAKLPITSGQFPTEQEAGGRILGSIGQGLHQDRALVVGNDFSIQNGYLETKLLLNKTDRPTAIFALSNTIMLGAFRAIREAGLKIPEDISLVAFDNNIYMDYMTPAITRIGQPTEEMGKLATKLLFECISSGERSTTQIELSPTLITGASVGTPNSQ